MFQKYASLASRLIFALYYFGVGVVGLAFGDRAKDIAHAPTAFQRALSETGFMDPLLCLACLIGGGAMFFRRTAPLGIVLYLYELEFVTGPVKLRGRPREPSRTPRRS